MEVLLGVSNMDFTNTDFAIAAAEFPMPAVKTNNKSPAWHYSPW